MLISTRGRYALRVMIDLAEQNTSGYIPMKDIAARQGISKKYMEQIIPVLAKNGLVDGVHGQKGGYRLTRSPEEYGVGEILRLTEGDLAPVACLAKDAEPCERYEKCKTVKMWDKFNKLTNEFFDGITIADLMEL
ncbi:MAG: RrF2 family transcriptional regulator [Bacteroides sp.]|nr:RrF2 family transcriptional regulator [Bacteroides sp.]